MKTFFACLTAAALCLSLCACMASGASSVPASSSEVVEPTAAPTAAPTENPSASAAPDTTLSVSLTEALNGTVAFAADTAGGSLKTAQASAALVQVLAAEGVPAGLTEGAAGWKATLTADQLTLLSLNWQGVSQLSRDIAADPASQQGLLETAGVETDFTAMDLSGISAAMDSLDAALLD